MIHGHEGGMIKLLSAVLLWAFGLAGVAAEPANDSDLLRHATNLR